MLVMLNLTAMSVKNDHVYSPYMMMSIMVVPADCIAYESICYR